MAAAFLLERLDDTICSPDEAERISGLVTLGVIPMVDEKMVAETELTDPYSPLSEAYRSFSTALQFATDSGLPKTLLVTSAHPSEGKSITSLAVAKHFATMGMRVLLIDADLRKPSLHVKLGLDNRAGLSSYLAAGTAPPEAFQATEVNNLAFMATGPLPPNAGDLLAGARLFSLLSTSVELFDLITIDGPPVLGLADAQLLSNAADATVFVIAAQQSRAGILREALRRLQLARGQVIGAVVTKYDPKRASNGYGYDYFGDRYTYPAYHRSASPYGQRRQQLTNSRENGQ